MANIVRQSKFRHVFCKPIKHENCMSDIRVTEITWDSLFCAVNPKFIAFINKGAGGPFLVIPVNKVGRIDKDYPFVDAHKAPCLEVVWSPFNDNVIASCSEDTTAKVWLIPDRGLIRTLSDPVVELSGHQKRVNTLAWHPTAQNILLTAGGENKLLMWNVGNGEALLEIAGHPDQIFSIGFNYDGSQIITTCKDRKIRIIDSHSGDVLKEGIGHEGVKPQRAIFLKDGRIFTTGFTKRSERLYALRDADNISEPIVQEELDTSNGVLFPFYDEDSGLLYLAGKGDCAIRYYEINYEAPFVHYINTYTTSEPQRAIGWMPKRGINSNENEISRIYKLTTKGVVDILQFFVPRKSDLFQADLYPDTRSTVPAITAEEFAEGKNAPPNLCPVNPGAAEVKPKVNVAKKANILASMPAQQAPAQNPYESSTPSSGQPSPTRTTASSQRSPRVDDDMGIVKVERRPSSGSSRQSTASSRRESPPDQPAVNPMIPKQQVNLKSRGERDDGKPLTSGQKRAAAELERIKRDQARTNTDDVPPEMVRERPSRTPSSVSSVDRTSVAGIGPNEPTNMEELLCDLQKMKLVLRQHERRIRLLEEQLADATMSNTYGLKTCQHDIVYFEKKVTIKAQNLGLVTSGIVILKTREVTDDVEKVKLGALLEGATVNAENSDEDIYEEKRAGGRGFVSVPLADPDGLDKRAGGRGFIASDLDFLEKRAGGRGFVPSDLEYMEKRAGGRGFLNVVAEAKRGGARGFSIPVDFHSAERRAGGRAFAMPATGGELWADTKRAGGRPFYGIADWKRAGGRLFHFYDSPIMKRGGGRGFAPSDYDKRAGGRAFFGPSNFGAPDFYPKRAGSRPFYAATSWRGYPLQK
ncbi:hypothetical protein FO519_005064 [Halicephalobus sp. NKZ332]|nr:hypothetical protein FO519_005064 [Halicephalobus sp. NKZ332]